MKNFLIISIAVLFLGAVIFVSSNVSKANSVSTSVWADSTSIEYGGSTWINWSSTGALRCSGGNTTSTDGRFNTGALTSSKTYTITCSNDVGCKAAFPTSILYSSNIPATRYSLGPCTKVCSNITTESSCNSFQASPGGQDPLQDVCYWN